jgi:hypothetical protein
VIITSTMVAPMNEPGVGVIQSSFPFWLLKVELAVAVNIPSVVFPEILMNWFGTVEPFILKYAWVSRQRNFAAANYKCQRYEPLERFTDGNNASGKEDRCQDSQNYSISGLLHGTLIENLG